MQYFIGILLLIALLVYAWPALLALFAIWVAYRIILHIRKEKYFGSEAFLTQKQALEAVVQEHNDIVAYVDQLRNEGSFVLGTSDTGKYAHLATFENTSHHKYRRDRNVAIIKIRTCIMLTSSRSKRCSRPIEILDEIL